MRLALPLEMMSVVMSMTPCAGSSVRQCSSAVWPAALRMSGCTCGAVEATERGYRALLKLLIRC